MFCCAGCRAVYHAITSAGLDSFYELRDESVDPVQPPAPDGSRLERFDSEAFLDEHAERLDDGQRRIVLQLDGVHCSGCVWLVEQMPRRVDGVVDARLNLSRGRLTVRWRPEHIELSQVAAWLEQFGYTAHPVSEGASAGSAAERDLLKRVGVTWALAANVMLLAFALYSGLGPGAEANLFTAFRWLSLALATGAVAYGGSVFFRRAWASLRPLWRDPTAFSPTQLSIDLPISVGILGGYLHSAVATVRGTGEVWFDSVSVLIAALLSARWLQVRGQRIARDAADRLLTLLPAQARQIVDGEPRDVPAEELETGALVEVRPDETIPADGRIREGSSAVEKGVLTGESRPERVEPGDEIFAGTKNASETLRMEVTAAGDASRIGELMAWIDSDEGDSAPIVQLADRIAGIFVLVVLGAAAATWMGWALAGSPKAVQHAVALLVVSCPCALGMATPLALTVGIGRGARRGIFVKDDGVFEQLDRLGELVVDKTGTLTEGDMTVVSITGDAQAVDLAAAVEHENSHPIGEALRRRAGENAPVSEVTDVGGTAGRGVEGRVSGRRVIVGRPDWVVRETDPMDDAHRRAIDEATERGHTPVAVAVDGEVAATVALGDPLRDGSTSLLDELRDRGIAVTMLSGDHPEVVSAVARKLDLPGEAARGHVSPEDKRAYVEQRREELQEDDQPVVAMVGDGVNDAAALRTADVGIAVDGSANPSFVAADVFLTREGLDPLFELFDGSRRVLRTVRRNVIMSIVYNAVAITAAAAGWITPLVAAVAMPISSLAVVVSSIVQGPFESDAGAPEPATPPVDSSGRTTPPVAPATAGESP